MLICVWGRSVVDDVVYSTLNDENWTELYTTSYLGTPSCARSNDIIEELILIMYRLIKSLNL